MLRFVNICLVLGLVALAYVIYQVKYQSRALDAEIATLGKQIDEERDGIAVLRAEWSLLNRPERIERLAQKYLKLAPAKPTQLVTIDTVTDRDFDRTRLEAVPPARGAERRRQSGPVGKRPTAVANAPAAGAAPASAPWPEAEIVQAGRSLSPIIDRAVSDDRKTRSRRSPRRASLSRARPLPLPSRLPCLCACLSS